MKKTPLLLGGLLLPSLVLANDHNQTIQTRQQAFESIEHNLEQAADTIDGNKTNWATLTAAATQLQQDSQLLKVSFPSGSQDGSKASENIWQDPDNFYQLMAQMDQGFVELYQAAQQQNAELAEQGIEKAQGTCRSCHRQYRSRW